MEDDKKPVVDPKDEEEKEDDGNNQSHTNSGQQGQGQHGAQKGSSTPQSDSYKKS